MKKLSGVIFLALLATILFPATPVWSEPLPPPDLPAAETNQQHGHPTPDSSDAPETPDVPGTSDPPAAPAIAEGATWRITWRGHAEGYSDTTDGGLRKIFKRVMTMQGNGIARWSEVEQDWKTTNFSWRVTDEYDIHQIAPCWKSHTRQTILEPNRPPLWVDDFLNPKPLGVDANGQLYMHVWFVHSNAGHPAFPYSYDSRWDSLCQNPSTTFSSLPGNRDSYGYIFWWYHNQLNPEWSNEPRLYCNLAGTHCQRTHHFTSLFADPPMRVSMTVTAQRLPDSPDIDQALELSEKSVFLPGVPLTNRVDGKLDCDKSSTCGATRIVRSGASSSSEKIGPAPTGNYPKELQIGSLPPGRTTIEAQADSVTARPPDNRMVQIAAKLPSWAPGVAGISVQKNGDAVSYAWSAKFPEPAIKKVTVSVPKYVTLCTGQKREVGYDLPQGAVKTEARSTGEVSLEGSIAGGVFWCEGSLNLEFAGRAKGVLDTQGVRNVSGEMDVKLTGKISAQTSLLDAIPTTKSIIEGVEVFDAAAAAYMRDVAAISLEIAASYATTFIFSDKTGELAIESARLTPGFGIQAKTALKVPDTQIEASVSLSLDVKHQFKTPPLEFEKSNLEGKATLEANAYHLKYTRSASFACDFTFAKPISCSTSISAREQGKSGQWELPSREYLNDPAYGRWVAPEIAAATADAGTTDIELVASVYPQARPTLALSGSRRMLVWSHDRADLPALSAQELAWSTSNGSGQPWQASAPATNDSLADFNGDLLLLSSNNGLALWERFDTAAPGDFNADPLAYLSHVQIAASRWNGSVWSAPQQLSSSGSVNHSPSLAPISGGALALWIGNTGNQLSGHNAAPDRLYAARFQSSNNTWLAPTLVLTDVSGFLGYAVASNGSKTALVYAQDLDNDFATRSDRELFYILWANNSWGAPVRLTNDSVADEFPRLALASSGAPYLVWNRAGGLHFLKGIWDASQAVEIPLPQATDAANLALTRGPNDRLALIWQEQTPLDTRIGYAVYDQDKNLWGLGATHTPPITATRHGPSSAAQSISAALESNRLLLSYQLAHLEPVTVTEDGLTISNFPTVTHYSLRYAEIPLALNLSVAAAEIAVTPLDAPPGAPLTVTAIIRNTGALASTPTTVELQREQYPNQLAVVPLPALAAGAAMTVALAATQPGTDLSPVAVVVDPQFSVWGESDRSDNEAPVISPPLVTPLTTLDTVLGPQVAARFQQQGIRQGDVGLTVSLRLDAPTGPELDVLSVVFGAKEAAEAVTATTTISPGLLGPGRHTIYWVVEEGYADGADVDGAATVTGAAVLADLTMDPYDVTLGAAVGATTPITGLVQNRGSWPNGPVALVIYDRSPDTPGAVTLASLPVPAIAPGATVTVTGALAIAPPPAALYLEIDPAQSSEESNRANNLIVVGQIGGEVVAPPQQRVYIPVVTR